jgi:hypothetical protein
VNFSRIAQEYERQLALLQIPANLPPAQLRYETKLLENGVCGVTITTPLDHPGTAMTISLGYLNTARRHKLDRILIYPHLIHLTPEQRYRNGRHGVEWLRGQGYHPRIALVSDNEADRFGMETVRDWGIDAACYPHEEEALRWLHSG